MCPRPTSILPTSDTHGFSSGELQTASTSRPARPQYAARLGESRVGVGHEHVAEAADDSVDRVVVKVEVLRVQCSELDVAQAELGTASACDLDHLRREVRRDQPAAVADQRGSGETGVAGTGCELENRVARLRRQLPKEPFAHGHGDLVDLGAPALPTRSHPLPRLEARAPPLVAIHRTPSYDAMSSPRRGKEPLLL